MKFISKHKVFLVVLVIILFAFSATSYFAYRAVGSAISRESETVKESESIVKSFLLDLSSQKYEAAYALTNSEFQAEVSLDDMNAFSETPQYAGIVDYKQTGYSVKKYLGEEALYTTSGVVTYDDGTKGNLTAKLVSEDGLLKIQYLYIVIDIDRANNFKTSNSESVLGVSTRAE